MTDAVPHQGIGCHEVYLDFLVRQHRLERDLAKDPLDVRILAVVAFCDRVRKQATNIQSLAETLSVPRETMRRKVVGLIERGALGRDRRGMLHVTGEFCAHIADLHDAAVENLKRTATRLLNHHDVFPP